MRAASGGNEADPTAGGFLVQQDFAEQLIGSIYEQSEIAQRCERRETQFPGRECPLPAVDETSRADGSRWGGVTSYWSTEAANISSSFPRFRRLAFNAQKIIAIVYGTGELAADVPDVRRAYAPRTVERAGLPPGPRHTRRWRRQRRNAAWGDQCRLHDPGRQGGANGGRDATLYGAPVIAVEVAPTLGTLGDIVLGDFGEYCEFGDRSAVRLPARVGAGHYEGR